MNKEKRFSDEFLNAFVDNQLAPEEKSRAYAEISQDTEINRQVCELRKLHDLVQLAYRDVPAPPVRTSAPQRRHRTGIAAAVAVMAIGIAVGLQIKPPAATGLQTQAPVVPAATVAVNASPKAVTPNRAAPHRTAPNRAATSKTRMASHAVPPPAAVKEKPVSAAVAIKAPEILDSGVPRSINDVHIGNVRNKVLIHIAHDDQDRLAQALDEIDGLMRYYRESRQSAHVEVVINGRGMELVRVDTSVHAARIARLQKEYDNLTFAACQNTIDRLKREQGISVRLLPGVVITDSGMAEIMRRQHQGWTYLQV